jgi:hypothetical protein
MISVITKELAYKSATNSSVPNAESFSVSHKKFSMLKVLLSLYFYLFMYAAIT